MSRAFTAPEVVAEATRENVLAAAAALGYQPNRAARGLITGRTGNVGVIVPDLGNPYFHGLLQGAEPVTSPGLVFMDTPGCDPVSVARSSPSPPAGGPRARSSASATRSSPPWQLGAVM